MTDIKIFTYLDEWLNRFINFHTSLEFPFTWILPVLYFCLAVVIVYYINYFIPKGVKYE